MKNLLIICGIMMVIVAVWQCDARPEHHNHHHHHHKDENKTEKIVVKSENGKILVVKVPKSKVNENRDRPKLTVDEDGNSILKHGKSEVEVVKINNGKTGKLKKKNVTLSESSSSSRDI
ncbi:unnamed protein product [Chironomus riparius]|uniref:Uncharacterized protein n=1 Tax=Chironomus riparius TaxID=315576 RepID=A0A9P0J6E8_9DIPT|nr:unnamed protein product [Chironomus riparius]